jgi:hypothetical protein
MAKNFQITTAAGISTLKLDSLGRATVQITAKNVSGAACDGRAVPISLPVTNPASGAVQNGWVKIDGPTEQHFDRDQEKVFVVKIAVPTKDKPKPGNYQFRVEVVSVATPDVGDASTGIAFTVPETVQKQSSFPLWLIPVLVLVVIALGVGAWLLMKPSGLTVPDLNGKTVEEADATLKSAGLIRDPNVQIAPGKPENGGKIISQNPGKGEKATKGENIQVTVGGVAVKSVIGQTLGQAIINLQAIGLAVAPSFSGDTTKMVSAQNPAPNTTVKAGSSVTLSFPMDTCAGKTCFYNGAVAHQMIIDQLALARSKGVKP